MQFVWPGAMRLPPADGGNPAGAMTFSAASSATANLYVTTTGNNAARCQTLGALSHDCLCVVAGGGAATPSILVGHFHRRVDHQQSVVLNGAGSQHDHQGARSTDQQSRLCRVAARPADHHRFHSPARPPRHHPEPADSGPGSSTCGSIGYGIFAGVVPISRSATTMC